MIENNQEVNSHVKEYLDWYCSLPYAPEFAILLKGGWGVGKTWFVHRYSRKLEERGQKCLYISLYGISNCSEIEDKLLQILHPIMASKQAKLLKKFTKDVIKGTIKIDLNSDKKDDGTLSIQIPEINLLEHLKDIDKSILIFDDLERCNVSLNNLLGYINNFVEHQEAKVVLVANEDVLIESNKKNYEFVKEKLIGKTFDISPNFAGALEGFLTLIHDLDIREFLSENIDVVRSLYNKAEYKNLRNLRQIVLEFERIFQALPEKVRKKPEVLQDLLSVLTVFSIETRSGFLAPKNIDKLQEAYTQSFVKRSKALQADGSAQQDNDEEQASLQKIISKYSSLDLQRPFPSASWWKTFFDQGSIDRQELEQAILSSRYFWDENTPDWIKLWHYLDLSDGDFEDLIRRVESDYNDRKFLELGVVKHIFGLFLLFSDCGIYSRSKEGILKDSKKYIDDLKSRNQLEPLFKLIPLPKAIEQMFGSYFSLGFNGTKFEEFREFCTYIAEAQRLDRTEKMPEAAQALLNTMRNDIWKFYGMLCPANSRSSSELGTEYYHETPILKYIPKDAFIEKFIDMNHADQRQVLWMLDERYKYENISDELFEELDWLESIRGLLLEEAARLQGKLSGFKLKQLSDSLQEIIEKLASKKERSQNNQ